MQQKYLTENDQINFVSHCLFACLFDEHDLEQIFGTGYRVMYVASKYFVQSKNFTK